MNVVSFYIPHYLSVNALFVSIFEFTALYSLPFVRACLSWKQGKIYMLKNLRVLRESRGYTQQQVADMVGVSQKSIQKYETTKYEPDIKTLIRIADVFDVSVDYLVGHQVSGEDPFYAINQNEYMLIEQYRGFDAPTRNSIKHLFEKLSKQ